MTDTKLDKLRPYAEEHGIGVGIKYIQDGKQFDFEGNEIKAKKEVASEPKKRVGRPPKQKEENGLEN